MIGVKERGEGFARVAALEADAARRAGGEGEKRGFIERLKIYGAGVLGGAQCADGGGNARGAFAVYWDYSVEIGIAFEEALPFGVNGPVDAGFGERVAQRGGGGEGVDYVAERA